MKLSFASKTDDHFFQCKCPILITRRITIQQLGDNINCYCKNCKTRKTVKLPKGYYLCPRCKGTLIKRIVELNLEICNDCNQTGMISWIDKVMK